jgi:hypothetical protein
MQNWDKNIEFEKITNENSQDVIMLFCLDCFDAGYKAIV